VVALGDRRNSNRVCPHSFKKDYFTKVTQEGQYLITFIIKEIPTVIVCGKIPVFAQLIKRSTAIFPHKCSCMENKEIENQTIICDV
jgi:hypothetical protein